MGYEIFMMLLAISIVLMTLWLGITLLLLGWMYALTPPSPWPQSISMIWPSRFLRGALGIGGTLRVGLLSGVLMGVASSPLSVNVRDGGIVFVGGAVLIALFNAGRRLSLSSAEELILCGILGVGWTGMFLVALGFFIRF